MYTGSTKNCYHNDTIKFLIFKILFFKLDLLLSNKGIQSKDSATVQWNHPIYIGCESVLEQYEEIINWTFPVFSECLN